MKSTAAQAPQTAPSPENQKLPGRAKGSLLLISILFCLLFFLGMDGLYSAHILRSSSSPATAKGMCFASDPVRHHALQANCSCIRHWGKDSYSFITNSLGFRDESERQVPSTVAHPRLLLLGDSFTEGMRPWPETYAGQLSARFPQYEFLNSGVESYSPSNYYNTARKLLEEGVQFDEAIVFIDVSDAQDEAAVYRDVNSSGAVEGPAQLIHRHNRYEGLRLFISNHFLITNSIVGLVERSLVRFGIYHLDVGHGSLFDLERSAWTYRPVSNNQPYELGYGPLGLEAGIQKERSKMTLLWEELYKRGIPVSVVVYPWPAQVVHDKVDSRQVQIWRDWCAGKCKRFISVFPSFFAAKNACPSTQPGCWYLKDFIFGDEHYSAAGNALMTDAVGRSLEQNPPFKIPQPSIGQRVLNPVQSESQSGTAPVR